MYLCITFLKIANKMENLEFTKEGKYYVTGTLTPNSDGVVPFQIGINSLGGMLYVEVRLDESLPWSKKAVIPIPRMPDTYWDKIVGIGDNDLVRIKVNHKPAIAAIG